MQIGIISFNIRFCDDPNGNSIAERSPRLKTIVSSYDADIIGFQEYRPAWEPYIKASFGDAYELFVQYRSADPGDREASPILWRREAFECVKTGYFWLSDTPEVESRGWDTQCSCYRMCVYALLKHKATGKAFAFMNTHFGFGDDCQVKSVRLLGDYSGRLSSYPICIVGDFNMTPDSPGYKLMSQYFTDVNAVTANDWRSTFHGYCPKQNASEHIDYCFINDGFRPLKQKIIDDLVDGRYPSDHYGLYTQLEL